MGAGVQLFSLAETPQLPPLPPHLGSYTRALLVSQDRQHLFVTRILNIPIGAGDHGEDLGQQGVQGDVR
jgi:hypothetical protein